MEGLDLYSLSRMTDTTNGCKEEAGKDDDTVRHDIILACPNQQTSNGISKSIKEAQSGILATDRIVVACDLTVSSIDALLAEISKHRQVVGVRFLFLVNKLVYKQIFFFSQTPHFWIFVT